MARWAPDSRGRLQTAALELFSEHGYEPVTATAIAERAGVTERTFYRQFGDKREILFGDGTRILDVITTAVDAVPVEPLAGAVGAALHALALDMQPRYDRLAVRAAIIAATPELQERELRKMASWATALASYLTGRGTDPATAEVCTAAAMAVFRIAFQRWLAAGPDSSLADLVAESLSSLAALLPDPGRR